MAHDENKGRKKLGAVATALLVAGALFVGLVVTSLITMPKTNVSIFRLFDPGTSGVQAEPDDSIDVLVVGDSLALNGYLPVVTWHEYGYTTYVLSTLAQNLTDGDTMLHLALRNQHPRYVIFEVQGLFDEIDFDDAFMSYASSIFPVLRYHSRWRELSAVDFTLTQQEQDYEYKPRHGAVYEHATVPVDEETLAAYMAPTDDVEAIDDFNSWYFAQMLAYCRSVGATPILVSTPCPSSWDMAHHNAISAWAKKQGVDYYDFNLLTEEMGIDWSTDSKDGGEHLNINGAQKLSRYLGELLVKKYDLPDHRGDQRYARWDEDYQEQMA